MSSIARRATPTITYAGRLKDPRKGIELFFDAIELLWASRPDAHLRVWIIGGSPAEVSFVEYSALARPNIADHADALTFWGRVDHECLREFYSRSTIVVVPSFREQFGMVAAEAEMCGTAVAAARVGGLQDVVVSGHTGMLFDAGNPAALAASLLSYINVPDLASWHGANGRVWSAARFTSERVLPMVEDLFRSAEVPVSTIDTATSTSAFIGLSIRGLVETVERLLDDRATEQENLTSSHSLSFRLKLERSGTVYVKQYSRRPPSLHTIHGDAAQPRLHDPAVFRLNLMSRLSTLPYVPTMLARDDNRGLIVQEWVDPAPAMSFEQARDVICGLSGEIANTEMLTPDTLSRFADACEKLAKDGSRMNAAIQERFDQLGAELHADLHGGVLACRRMHPQVELYRIFRFLERNRAWLPQNYSLRALTEVRRLLTLKPFLPHRPRFAHGSLKTEHILGAPQRYFLCDFDQTGYWVGPADTAHWVWEYLEREPEVAREVVLLDVLKELTTGEEQLYLAVCWLLVLTLNKDLVYTMRGEWERLDNSLHSLWTFCEAVRLLPSFS